MIKFARQYTFIMLHSLRLDMGRWLEQPWNGMFHPLYNCPNRVMGVKDDSRFLFAVLIKKKLRHRQLIGQSVIESLFTE